MLVSYDFQGVKTSHLRLTDSRLDGEAYNIKLTQGLNKLDELEFQLPVHIINRENGQQERNWRVDQIMPEQKVRLTFQNYDDYFYVRHIEESHSNGITLCLVRCVHAAEILVKTGLNKVIDMEGTAEEVLTTIISGSGWTVGTCSTFMQGSTEKIRHYKKNNSNIMEMLCEIAELFEGYLTFDAVNKKVNLLVNIGNNDGVCFRYSKNLRDITRITDTENITTRLWVWGGSIDVAGISMNVSINEVTDNKNPFLDDWSYYWDYMTQAQKDAITAYNTNIITINNNIQTAQASVSDTETDKYDAEQERDTKNIQLNTKKQVKIELEKQLQIEKDPVVITSINNQLATIDNEITTLNNQISTLNTQISNYTNTLTTLNSNLNNYISQLTTQELTLRATVGDFIKEGIYKNDQYVNKTALFNDAKNILAEVCKPKVTYNMSVIDLSQLSGYTLEKFGLGDIVGITDDLLNIGIPTPVPARIREITKVLDNPRQNTITISNFKGSFADEYKRISKSAEIVNQRLEYYERAYLGLTSGGLPKGDVLQQAFDNNKFTIVNGTNNKVTWDNNGLTCEDSIDTNKKVRLNSGGIFITTDGGTSWKVGMSAQGMSATNIVSGVLDTRVIQIWNTEEPKFFWNDKGLYAYGTNNDNNLTYNVANIYNIASGLNSPLTQSYNASYNTLCDNNGTLFVAFDSIQANGKYDISIYKSIDDGQTWSKINFPLENDGHNRIRPTIHLGINNEVHMFYQKFENDLISLSYIKHVRYNGTTWVDFEDVIKDIHSNHLTGYAAMDSNGKWHLMADRWDINIGKYVITYTNNVSGSWLTPEVIDYSGHPMYHPAMVMQDNIIHVFFTLEGINQTFYTSRVNGTWTSYELVCNSTGRVRNAIIADNQVYAFIPEESAQTGKIIKRIGNNNYQVETITLSNKIAGELKTINGYLSVRYYSGDTLYEKIKIGDAWTNNVVKSNLGSVERVDVIVRGSKVYHLYATTTEIKLVKYIVDMQYANWIRFNSKGLYGTKKSNVNPVSTNENDFNLLLNWDKLQLRTADNKGQVKFSVSEGIKFQAGDGTGSNWTDIFNVDSITGTIKSVGELILKGNGITLFDTSNVERYKCGDLGSGVYGFRIKDSSGNDKVITRSDGTLKLVDGELQIGSGSNIVKINGTNGILVGGADVSTARFTVAMDGTTIIKGGSGGIIRSIGSDGVKLTDGTNELKIDGGFGTGVEFRYSGEYRGGLKCASSITLEADNAASLIISQKNPSGYVYLRGGVSWDATEAGFDNLHNSSGQPYVTSNWVNSQGFVTSSWVITQINSAIAAHVSAYHSG